MKRSNNLGQCLAAVFFLGCLLLNYPILFLFDRPIDVFGIPLLYLYIFGAWILLIALIAWMTGLAGE